MPLTNIQEQVLEHVWREGKKCRGGVPTQLVVVQLAHTFARTAVIGTLHDLKGEELVSVTGADEVSRGWMATTKGEAALRGSVELEADSFLVTSGLEGIPQEGTWLLEKGEPVSSQPVRSFSSEEICDIFSVPGRVVCNPIISRDLLDRCAAMNATLLAQADQAHAAGDTDAWRDLAWLMETGRQLVAIGGEV